MKNISSKLKKKILVVDDDREIRDFLDDKLNNYNYDVTTVENGIIALAKCKKEKYSMIILDYEMPDMDGMQVIKGMNEMNITSPVVMLTAHDTMERAVEAISLGAKDFLTKPFDFKELLVVLEEYADSEDADKIEKRKTASPPIDVKYNLVGSSSAMMNVYKSIGHISQTDNNNCVLITGESGVGKELVARQIHLWGKNKSEPFIGINLNAMPESLIESELFGHSQGAFTSATKQQAGKLEFAGNGTILLDEIGDLPMNIQVKLLRLLQEREYYPVGSNKVKSVSCRIIAATNADLEEKIQNKEFRKDLFYRLRTIWIDVPPLRDRLEDIPLLADFFVKKYENQDSTTKNIKFSNDAINLLKSHDWQGNVRELENAIKSAIATCRKNILEDRDLGSLKISKPVNSVDFSMSSLQDARNSVVENFEKNFIKSLLLKYKGKVSKVAEHAEVNRQTIYKLIRKYNINLSDY